MKTLRLQNYHLCNYLNEITCRFYFQFISNSSQECNIAVCIRQKWSIHAARIRLTQVIELHTKPAPDGLSRVKCWNLYSKQEKKWDPGERVPCTFEEEKWETTLDIMRIASIGKKIVKGAEDFHPIDDREEDRWTCSSCYLMIGGLKGEHCRVATG